jgi:hypothetical protein
MFLILILFLPYLLVPLFSAHKNLRVAEENRSFPYLINAIILSFCPIILFWIIEVLFVPITPKKCYTPEANFVIFNTVFLIPMALTTQVLTGCFFRKQRAKISY